MSTVLNFQKDVQGFNTYAPRFSVNKLSTTLSNGIEETFTIPAYFANCVISIVPNAGGNIWVSVNESSQLPTSGSFIASNSEQNPGPRLVNGGDVVHVITSQSTCDVSVILYAVTQ